MKSKLVHTEAGAVESVWIISRCISLTSWWLMPFLLNYTQIIVLKYYLQHPFKLMNAQVQSFLFCFAGEGADEIQVGIHAGGAAVHRSWRG